MLRAVLGLDLDLSLFFIARCVNLYVCLDFSEPQLPHLESENDTNLP